MTKQSYKKQVLRGFLKDVETVGANTAKQGSFTCKTPCVFHSQN